MTKESYLLCCKSHVFYSVKVVKRKDRFVGNKPIRKAPVKQIRLTRISDSQNGCRKFETNTTTLAEREGLNGETMKRIIKATTN